MQPATSQDREVASMRRLISVLSVVALMAALLALGSGVALAAEEPRPGYPPPNEQAVGPTENEHNCGGTSSFESTHTPQEILFGDAVSNYAPLGVIPLYTAANCKPLP